MSPPHTSAPEVIALAVERGLMLAVAESCTGGLIGGALTAVEGSSAAFLGSIVAYHNSLKVDVLGVESSDLLAHGAISERVASQMAAGALKLTGADVAVSVTGIAGPGGGSAIKPVGTVWIGVATKEGTHARLCEYGNLGREGVREATVSDALDAFAEAIAG